MIQKCVIDGREFEAKRASARYCSERCKKRAQRSGTARAKLRSADVLAFPTAAPDEAERSTVEGELARTTREQLEAAHREDTPLGVAVLLMAKRLDNVASYETGSSLAALVREWAAKLDTAVKHADVDGGAIEEIRGAALELIRGSRGA
jgi:hypothetical protein